MNEAPRALVAPEPAPAQGASAGDTGDPRDDVSTRNGTIRTLEERVQAEYAEMPGLSVTLPQAQRLWAADRPTCEAVFSRLVATGVLRRTRKGRFVRS